MMRKYEFDKWTELKHVAAFQLGEDGGIYQVLLKNGSPEERAQRIDEDVQKAIDVVLEFVLDDKKGKCEDAINALTLACSRYDVLFYEFGMRAGASLIFELEHGMPFPPQQREITIKQAGRIHDF